MPTYLPARNTFLQIFTATVSFHKHLYHWPPRLCDCTLQSAPSSESSNQTGFVRARGMTCFSTVYLWVAQSTDMKHPFICTESEKFYFSLRRKWYLFAQWKPKHDLQLAFFSIISSTFIKLLWWVYCVQTQSEYL